MKKNEFVLRIALGNDACSDDADVADILRKAADYVESMGTATNRSYNVRDLNGNKVGNMGRYSTEEEDLTVYTVSGRPYMADKY